jgi:uncharacterized protein (DUF952 family)
VLYRLAKSSEIPEDAWRTRLDWTGLYAGVSPLDDAFLHLSTLEQVVSTARLYFPGAKDLQLLRFGSALIEEYGELEVRFEEACGQSPGCVRRDGEFPHVYGGPIPYACLVGPPLLLPLGPDGLHVFPAGDELEVAGIEDTCCSTPVSSPFVGDEDEPEAAAPEEAERVPDETDAEVGELSLLLGRLSASEADRLTDQLASDAITEAELLVQLRRRAEASDGGGATAGIVIDLHFLQVAAASFSLATSWSVTAFETELLALVGLSEARVTCRHAEIAF